MHFIEIDLRLVQSVIPSTDIVIRKDTTEKIINQRHQRLIAYAQHMRTLQQAVTKREMLTEQCDERALVSFSSRSAAITAFFLLGVLSM